MKKTLLSIVLIIAMVFCAVSCNKTETTPPTNDESKTVWETLQKLSQKKYDEVILYINTVTGNIELNANYILTNSVVAYSVEKLNTIPSDGDLTDISPEYKTTISGTATIRDGKVNKIDGNSVDIPFYNELSGKFNFQESNFKNIKAEDGKVVADVASVSGFMGTSKNLSNMRIVVTYSDTALQRMEIRYNTANSEVVTVYEFVK